MNRRRYLSLFGAGSLATVAGCLGDDDEPADDTGDDDTDGDQSDDEMDGPAAQSRLTFDHPGEVQYDQPFSMVIDGLPAQTAATVQFSADDPEDDSFARLESEVTVSTENGSLDLSAATVIDGDVPSDFAVPTTVALSQFSDRRLGTYSRGPTEELRYTVTHDGTELGSTTLTRQYYDPQQSSEHLIDTDGLHGRLIRPPDEGSGPGIVHFHGAGGPGGTTGDAIARTLAYRGFTVLAVQYFGRTRGDGPDLPDSPVRVPLEYVETAIEWLGDHNRVQGESVGLVGHSLGGMTALLAGSEFSSVGAVVSYSGSGVLYDYPDFQREDESKPSFTRDGEPLSGIPIRDPDRTADVWHHSWQQATEAEIEAATIPVEQIEGPVVLVAGEDNEIWPVADLHTVARDRLAAHDHPEFEHLVYEDTGHTVLPPYLPMKGTAPGEEGWDGGTKAGAAYAAHDHWPRVIEAFETLRG